MDCLELHECCNLELALVPLTTTYCSPLCMTKHPCDYQAEPFRMLQLKRLQVSTNIKAKQTNKQKTSDSI